MEDSNEAEFGGDESEWKLSWNEVNLLVHSRQRNAFRSDDSVYVAVFA